MSVAMLSFHEDSAFDEVADFDVLARDFADEAHTRAAVRELCRSVAEWAELAPGRTREEFFAAATALTGQDLAAIGRMREILGDYAALASGSPSELLPADLVEFVALHSGEGCAADDRDRQHKMVDEFMRCLVAYGGIICAARKNIINNMYAFVQEMRNIHTANSSREFQFKTIAWHWLVEHSLRWPMCPAQPKPFFNLINGIGALAVREAVDHPMIATNAADIADIYLRCATATVNGARRAIVAVAAKLTNAQREMR